MKRFVALLLSLLMVVSLCACGETKTETSQSAEVKTEASNTEETKTEEKAYQHNH